MLMLIEIFLSEPNFFFAISTIPDID